LDEFTTLHEGLTAAELARARKKPNRQQQIPNRVNDVFAYMTGLDELYGLALITIGTGSQVNAVTLDDIKRVRRSILGSKPTCWQLSDRQKSPQNRNPSSMAEFQTSTNKGNWRSDSSSLS